MSNYVEKFSLFDFQGNTSVCSSNIVLHDMVPENRGRSSLGRPSDAGEGKMYGVLVD